MRGMSSLKARLQEILIRDKIILKEDLEEVLVEQKKSGGDLGKILLKRKLINEDQLAQLLSEGLGIPSINIARIKIDPSVIKAIPLEIAEQYNIIPISQIGEILTLAMIDPLNIFAIDNIEALTGFHVIPVIARPSDIRAAIQRYYGDDSSEKLEEIIKDIHGEDLELIKYDEQGLDSIKVEDFTQEAPIIRLTDAIIQQSVLAKASDIFIEPLSENLRIRFRIDGVIKEVDRMSKVLHFPIISRIKIISNLDISEHRLPQDGRFRAQIEDHEVDFRVSVLPTVFGEKIVLRVLDKNSAILDISKLGFDQYSLEKLKECSLQPYGMILSCGPTGSGKTTTLYAILNYIDSPEKNIVTVEDPVEYQMKGINQVNIRTEVGLTFSTVLRSILRQDPDIILIGEIRDTETLDIAVKAALTGHLVMSSIHTTTAAGSIIRMMNMGVEPYLICSSVIAIIGQRLLRKLCTQCREPYKVQAELIEKLALHKLFKEKEIQFYRAKGCQECMNTGYQGRVGIIELLTLTPAVKELILARVGEYKIKEIGRQEGMRTMREDGLIKAHDSLTSLEEVLRVTAPDDIIETKSS